MNLRRIRKLEGSPLFTPTCPRCRERNWHDARTCKDCGARLYPTDDELRRANVWRDDRHAGTRYQS